MSFRGAVFLRVDSYNEGDLGVLRTPSGSRASLFASVLQDVGLIKT